MVGGSGSDAEASGLVNTLQCHVDDIRSLIQCGICIRPLYEPYTLACGHTFCYSCLSSWFSGGRSKRTCPDCRAPVKTQPAPAYLVRAVVQMFTSRAELLDKGETTAEHSKNRKEEAERLDKDKANTNQQSGGLFGGLFRPKAPSLKPVVDVDDGVVRCPSCAWELEDGEHCPGCGWHYRPDEDRTDYSGSDDPSDTDYDSMDDEFGDLGEDEFGEMEDDDSVWGQYLAHGAPPEYLDRDTGAALAQIRSVLEGVYHPHGWAHSHYPMAGLHTDGSEYDEEEFNDFDDMDSFIDDGDHLDDEEDDSESDRDTVVGSTPAQHRPLPPREPLVIPYVPTSDEEDGDEDDASEVYDDDDSSMAPVQAWDTSSPSQAEGTPSGPTYHDTRSWRHSTSEPETDNTDNIQAAEGRRYSHNLLSPEGAEESESQSSSSPPRPMRSSRNTGSSARNAITIDDSEDEQPVGPVRRGTQRRRARFSPY